MRILLTHAGQLLTFRGPARARAGAEMRELGLVRGGAVLVEDGLILAVGTKSEVMAHEGAGKARIVDAEGRVVMPGLVDSHSHPVFAAPRLDDFAARVAGKTYEQISASGGGIKSSVAKVRAASEQELVDGLCHWAGRFLECGTTTLEAKSGYGLELESELKMLRAIKRAGELSALELVPTFLGAHAVPAEFAGRASEYADHVCERMIPAVAEQGLARFADVFCERGYFSQAEAERVLSAAAKAGLKAKLHAEQLSRCGGARLAAKLGAVSADHLDCAAPEDFEALKASGTVATLLPAANFFLNAGYPPARAMIEAGVPVALATDFNPGTAPCWNMQTVLSIACTQMKLSPEEALCAATINGAAAVGLAATHGSIEPGKQADLIILDASDYREIPYYFGGNLVSWVMKQGKIAHSLRHLRPFD